MHAHTTTDQKKIFGGVESWDHRFEDLHKVNNIIINIMQTLNYTNINEAAAIIDLSFAMAKITNARLTLKSA